MLCIKPFQSPVCIQGKWERPWEARQFGSNSGVDFQLQESQTKSRSYTCSVGQNQYGRFYLSLRPIGKDATLGIVKGRGGNVTSDVMYEPVKRMLTCLHDCLAAPTRVLFPRSNLGFSIGSQLTNRRDFISSLPLYYRSSLRKKMIEHPEIGCREEQTFSIYLTCPLDGNQLNCLVSYWYQVIHIESFDYLCTFTSDEAREC